LRFPAATGNGNGNAVWYLTENKWLGTHLISPMAACNSF